MCYVNLIYYKEAIGDQFQDQELLTQYRALRQRCTEAPCIFQNNHEGTLPPHLFAPSPSELQDPIAEAFARAKTLDQALTKLQKQLSKEEINLLKRTFNAYSSIFAKIDQETEETTKYNISYINELLKNKDIERHLSKIEKFYNSSPTAFKEVSWI